MRTRLSAKGQIVVPSAIRRTKRWQPGTEFDVEERDGGLLLRPVTSAGTTSIAEVFGCLKYDGPALTVEEMHDAVARSFGRRRP
jgi:AbrB family looped-hinge helix DNA binding protein